MKKIICMMGVLVLISTALVGCGKSKSNTSSDNHMEQGQLQKRSVRQLLTQLVLKVQIAVIQKLIMMIV
ncbi:hypothetical protein AKUA1401_02140 [Apilactobacillus kunkeei]|nr:hypothetical protein AKUA1401_02140 [Apilactobacillus kunkeei]